MTEITAEQLMCVFPLLPPGKAPRYAKAASKMMGPILGNKCAWAAFLGNVAIETKELTIWKEIKCATQAPYCGRGPLQITGSTNYGFCAAQPVCNCPDLGNNIESAAHDDDIGFGTAACVWEDLFGHSLTPLADGTQAGFIKTCCSIHQGHYPCGKTWQYGNRERYWNTANSCLGAAVAAGTTSDLRALSPRNATRAQAERRMDAHRVTRRKAAAPKKRGAGQEGKTRAWARQLVSRRVEEAARRLKRGGTEHVLSGSESRAFHD